MLRPISKQKKSQARRWLGGLAGIMLIALLLAGVAASTTAQASGPRLGQVAQTDPTPPPAPDQQHATIPQTVIPGEIAPDNDNEKELTADEVAQLQALQNKTLSEAQVAQLKSFASDKIVQYGPILLEKLDAKAKAKQETRLFWIAMLIIVAIPLIGLLIFLLYPLVMRKKFRERAPNATLGQIYKLYLPQALLVTLVLLGLGTALWSIQALTGRVLGGAINPQLVLQREAVNYVIDNRDYLIDNYTELMVGLADDIARADPEKPIFEIILENAYQLKEDPLVNTGIQIVRFVMPFLNYLALISYGILVLFFLVRIRPDIVQLLRYPLDILEADHKGQSLPAFASTAVGVIPSEATTGASMRLIGRKLMWNEVKVISLFALAVLVVAVIMSFALILFFNPIVGLLVGTLYDAAEYFLLVPNTASALVNTTVILMVFVVECVALFLFAFTFALGKLQDVLRQRFGGRITWKQTGQFMLKVGARFGWIMVLVGIFGLGLPFLAEKLDETLYNHVQEPNWNLLLLVIPSTLLIGLNLGFWLLRGFKMLVRLVSLSAAVELGLKPAEIKAEPQLVTK